MQSFCKVLVDDLERFLFGCLIESGPLVRNRRPLSFLKEHVARGVVMSTVRAGGQLDRGCGGRHLAAGTSWTGDRI